MGTSLTPHEVEQLVSLRLALEDALARAKGASKYRRGSAIVALDAVVERASAMVAVTRGVTVTTKGGLEGLVGRLVESLGERWKPKVLPDVRHLHRARNASQHEGLEPDRDQVPLWASATEMYVSTLVDAQFDVDVRRVVLSDAIQNEDLCAHIRRAEGELDLGNPQLCVEHAKAGYQAAQDGWKRLRGSRRSRRPRPMRRQIVDGKSHEYLDSQIGEIHSVLNTLTFSLDAAEAEWFLSAIKEQGNLLDADDADRALSFVFDWIVAYERAAESWTPDRRYRRDVGARRVRSTAKPAHIDECLNVDLHLGSVRAIFRIADVPAEDEYQLWAKTLREILPANNVDNGYWWTVSDAGTVEIEKSLGRDTSFATEVTLLKAALSDAHETLIEKIRILSEQDEARLQQRSSFAQRVENIRDDLPEWVTDIEWPDDGIGGSEQMVLTVTDEVLNLRFGNRTEGSLSDDRIDIRGLLYKHDLVRECYGLGLGRKFGIMPILDEEQLKRVFGETDELVQERIAANQRRAEEASEAIASAKASIAGKLIRMS